MSFYLVTKHDDLLLPWAAKRIAHVGDPNLFGPAAALGVFTAAPPEGRLLAVVVYHQFVPEYRSCEISMASVNAKWCDRNTIRSIFRIPFYQYDCNRVWTAIPHTSERVIRFNKVLGFKQEGVLRDAFGPKVHCVVMGLLRREFEKRYIEHGQIKSLSTASA